MPSLRSRNEARAPVWVWILVGWLLGEAWLVHGRAVELRRRRGPGDVGWTGVPWDLRECSLEDGPPARGLPTIAALRAVPGVGRVRAAKLAGALWEMGAGADFGQRPVAWEDVPGIGPVTSAALAAAFDPPPDAGPTGSLGPSSRPPAGFRPDVGCRVPPNDGVHSSSRPVMTLNPPESAARGGERPTNAAPSPGHRRAARPPVGPEGDGDAPQGPEVDALLQAALDEDVRDGDLTSDTAVPAAARARARLVAKEAGVLAGLPQFVRTFELCDPDIAADVSASDGDRIEVGDELASIQGNARALLRAERTALNLLQRLSGIATQTARLVDIARRVDSAVRILDTRKTTPGLRLFEKYAVRCGGGENHRFGLYDEAMVKENHVELAGRPIERVLADLRASVGPAIRITCEARDGAEARAAVAGGADVVLLDNMSPAEMADLGAELRRLAAQRERPLELEASGGITAETLARVAESGVDRISVGSLTHSSPALDLSLYLEPLT